MTVQLAQANSIRLPLADESVHCCITSPPYLGLRDYGLPPVVWGPERCWHGGEHEWGEKAITVVGRNDSGEKRENFHGQVAGYGGPRKASQGQFCQHCGVWRGALGLEPSPDLYVAHLVEVFREVRRVLRGDGTVWLNLGFSYSQGGGKQVVQTKRASYGLEGMRGQTPGLPAKQIIPIPWLVALALQADGWWLRSAPPWLKRNCLPESVRDRPTTAHEYWLMLTKSARYWYDAEAVREPHSQIDRRTKKGLSRLAYNGKGNPNERQFSDDASWLGQHSSGRNRRTTDTFFESLDAAIAQQRRYLRHLEHVRDNGGMLLDEDGDPLALVFNTKGYKGAHYAVFPADMIEPLVKCSTSERGCCPECGAGWERVVERKITGRGNTTSTLEDGLHQRSTAKSLAQKRQAYRALGMEGPPPSTTTGWRPTCTCYDEQYKADFPKARRARKRHQRDVSGDWWERVRQRPGRPEWHVKPATVLDNFVGSGTVCEVARKLGRHSVGFDLSFDYLRDQARTRLELDKLAAWEGRKRDCQYCHGTGVDIELSPPPMTNNEWFEWAPDHPCPHCKGNGAEPVQAAWDELPLFAGAENS